MGEILVKLASIVVTQGDGDNLAAYGVGSTVAVLFYDQSSRVGGCLQFMLPLSSCSPQRARDYPGMFADTGIAQLLKMCLSAGAHKESLTATLVGGSDLMEKGPGYRVGKENVMMAKRMLSEIGIPIQIESTGGYIFRTVRLDVKTGKIYLKGHGGCWEELR